MNIKIYGQRLRKTLTAIAVVLLALLGTTTATSAAPTIDASAKGSIVIHKLKNAPTGMDRDNGLPNATIDPVAHPPIEGVTFSVQRITDVDLATNAGWETLEQKNASFTPRDGQDGYGLGQANLDTATTLNTLADGTATFSDLSVGAYLVKETAVPAGSGLTPVQPFIVTIPMSHPTNLNTWLYDIHVYPKNPAAAVTKAVTEGNSLALGENVTWTIKADVPAGANPITGFRVEDNLDAKLGYVSTAVSVTDCPAGTTAPSLASPADFTLTAPAVGDAGQVKVEFTPTGDLKLESARSCKVTIDIVTAVEQIGEITNKADFFPNGGVSAVTDSTPAQIKFGTHLVKKVKAEDATAGLPGAEFSVFRSKSDAESRTNPISINGTSVFTSDADGDVVIAGLRFSNFKDGAAVAAGGAGEQKYWLLELKAPTGYELLAQPLEFSVDSVAGTTAVEVKNVKKNAGFELPFTGGTGSTMAVVAGALLIATSFAILVRRSRRLEERA